MKFFSNLGYNFKGFLYISFIWFILTILSHWQGYNISSALINWLPTSPFNGLVGAWDWNTLTPLFLGSGVTLPPYIVNWVRGLRRVRDEPNKLQTEIQAVREEIANLKRVMEVYCEAFGIIRSGKSARIELTGDNELKITPIEEAENKD